MSSGPLSGERVEKGASAQNSLGIFHRPYRSSCKILRVQQLPGSGLPKPSTAYPRIWGLKSQLCRAPVNPLLLPSWPEHPPTISGMSLS